MTEMTRRMWGRRDWEPVVDEYLSGPKISQRAFADARGLKRKMFSRWLRRIQQERALPRSSGVEFVEVEVVAATPLVRVCVGDVSVEFTAVPPPAWVAELVAYREARSC